MQAVHFGAGNIGRGFIGLLLYHSGYYTTFVDVNGEIIDALNEKQSYRVILASDKKEEQTVTNVSGINSIKDPEKVADAIASSNIVTTAVGPNILPIISELIAKGLRKRIQQTEEPLTIIACENMIGGSSLLKEKVYDHLTDEEKTRFDTQFAFPDSAVDRIVPNQVNEDKLTVSVEPYYEWVVEETGIKGENPPVKGITYVKDLEPYIERKLFTVNTGHATVAYLGFYLGYQTIKEAMDAKEVYEIARGALQESGSALIQLYQFDRAEHEAYIEKILNRFVNPYISDEVTRVARGPIRKLGAKDRLIRPASLSLENGIEPVHLAKTITAALMYDYDQDEEAIRLQQFVQSNGYEKALKEFSGLEEGHPLVKIILEQMEELKKIKNK